MCARTANGQRGVSSISSRETRIWCFYPTMGVLRWTLARCTPQPRRASSTRLGRPLALATKTSIYRREVKWWRLWCSCFISYYVLSCFLASRSAVSYLMHLSTNSFVCVYVSTVRISRNHVHVHRRSIRGGSDFRVIEPAARVLAGLRTRSRSDCPNQTLDYTLTISFYLSTAFNRA